MTTNTFDITAATDRQIEAWLHCTPRVRAAVREAADGSAVVVEHFTTTERRWIATLLGFEGAPGYAAWLVA